MDKETFAQHKPFAGTTKPSMLRRRIGHDYTSRCMYLITITTEGRRPLLGVLRGKSDAPDGSPQAPRIEPTELGQRVAQLWHSIPDFHPEVEVIALQLMPDHLHGILFVHETMKQHLGKVIAGFKQGCTKVYRLLAAASSASTPLQPSHHTCDHPHDLLFSRGYNDHILSGKDTLKHWLTYLHNNPRRLLLKRDHPDLLRVRFGLTIADYTFAAIGNRLLLTHPHKVQVQCSRRLSEDDIHTLTHRFLSLAQNGAVLVSPAISHGEQVIMRAALDAHLPLIFLTPWGFNTFSKPGHQYYNACTRGQLLLLAPWEHQNRRIPLTRNMCLALNAMTQAICNYVPEHVEKL